MTNEKISRMAQAIDSAREAFQNDPALVWKAVEPYCEDANDRTVARSVIEKHCNAPIPGRD